MHYDRSGNASDAVKYSLLAADYAERSGAIPEAIQHLTIARRNEARPDHSQEILLRLGHLHYLHQNLRAAAGILGLASDKLRASGDDRRGWEAELEQVDCLLRLSPSLVPNLLGRLREMKSSLLAQALYEAYARALDIEIHALDRQSDVAGVQACFAEADLVARIGSPRARCMAHCTLAMHQLYGIPRRALISARKAVSLAETHHLDSEWPMAINRLILVLNYQGLLSSGGGLELIDQAERAAEKGGDLLLHFTLRLNRGVWYLDTGEYELAETAFTKARTLLDDAGPSAASCLLNMNFGELNLMTGDIPKAARFFQRAVSATNGSTPANIATAAEAGMGICELHQGDLRKARTRSASLRFPEHWSFDPSLPVIFQARMHSRRGDLAAAITALSTTASSIEKRFPLSWIKLRTEEARLLHKSNRQNATALAQEVHQKASELGLRRRCAALELLM